MLKSSKMSRAEVSLKEIKSKAMALEHLIAAVKFEKNGWIS